LVLGAITVTSIPYFIQTTTKPATHPETMLLWGPPAAFNDGEIPTTHIYKSLKNVLEGRAKRIDECPTQQRTNSTGKEKYTGQLVGRQPGIC
jgi:hypothetical protein